MCAYYFNSFLLFSYTGFVYNLFLDGVLYGECMQTGDGFGILHGTAV